MTTFHIISFNKTEVALVGRLTERQRETDRHSEREGEEGKLWSRCRETKGGGETGANGYS